MDGYVYAAAQARVAAPPEQVFALVTDWPRHREWMVLTSARQVGDRVEAFTGVGPLGFLDVMTISRWEPPHVVEMRHVGRLLWPLARPVVNALARLSLHRLARLLA